MSGQHSIMNYWKAWGCPKDVARLDYPAGEHSLTTLRWDPKGITELSFCLNSTLEIKWYFCLSRFLINRYHKVVKTSHKMGDGMHAGTAAKEYYPQEIVQINKKKIKEWGSRGKEIEQEWPLNPRKDIQFHNSEIKFYPSYSPPIPIFCVLNIYIYSFHLPQTPFLKIFIYLRDRDKDNGSREKDKQTELVSAALLSKYHYGQNWARQKLESGGQFRSPLWEQEAQLLELSSSLPRVQFSRKQKSEAKWVLKPKHSNRTCRPPDRPPTRSNASLSPTCFPCQGFQSRLYQV